MFKCQECGMKFRTVKAAEKASSVGCSKCGGVDIDVDVPSASSKPATADTVSSYPYHMAERS